jgi:type II secretory pathway pseudopilin PulG
MNRLRNQDGASLIILIGVIAALSILAVSVVRLTGNVQHNTQRERMRVKAFGLAEAALDVARQQLSRGWPTAEQPASFDAGAFTASFFSDLGTSDEFPQPSSGSPLVRVRFEDDGNPAVAYDANDNGRLIIDSQAATGNGRARIRAEVQAVFFDVGLIEGVPLYAGDYIDNNSVGNGSNPKVTVEVFPPNSTSATIYSYNLGIKLDLIGAWYTQLRQGAGNVPDRNAILPDTTIQGLKKIAQSMQPPKYFDEAALAARGGTLSDEELSGLCVVEASSAWTIQLGQLNAHEVYNSEREPGILLVLGGAGIKLCGQTEYFGVVYTAGDLSCDVGTPIVHGMLITDGIMDLKGTPDIRYNWNCVRRLSREWLSGARLMPNYWREVQPEASAPATP